MSWYFHQLRSCGHVRTESSGSSLRVDDDEPAILGAQHRDPVRPLVDAQQHRRLLAQVAGRAACAPARDRCGARARGRTRTRARRARAGSRRCPTTSACVAVVRELLDVDHAAEREQGVLERERTARPFVRLRVEPGTGDALGHGATLAQTQARLPHSPMADSAARISPDHIRRLACHCQRRPTCTESAGCASIMRRQRSSARRVLGRIAAARRIASIRNRRCALEVIGRPRDVADIERSLPVAASGDRALVEPEHELELPAASANGRAAAAVARSIAARRRPRRAARRSGRAAGWRTRPSPAP